MENFREKSKRTKDKKDCLDMCFDLFKIFGCWRDVEANKPWYKDSYYLCTTLMILSQLSYLLVKIYEAYFSEEFWKNMEKVVEDLTIVTTVTFVLLKALINLKYQKEFEELKDQINFNLRSPTFLEDDNSSVIECCIQKEKLHVFVYLFFGYITVLFYFFSGILNVFMPKTPGVYKLPLRYPFQPQGMLFYISFAHQITMLSIIGHIGPVCDSIFSSIAFCVAKHFEVLKQRISKKNRGITREFIRDHNKVISMVEKLELIYSPILFYELSLNSGILCLAMYNVTVDAQQYFNYLGSVFYLSLRVFQLFAYCWYGEELIQKSYMVCEGAYFGSWPDHLNKKNGQNLINLIVRCQKPVQVRGGNYIKVSLTTMTTVMQTAYSFFAMLKSVKSDVTN